MYLDRKPISLAEAQAHLAAIEIKPRMITKKAAEAHGFVLAEDILARFPIPFFRRSGMDGYGIIAADNDENFPKDFEIIDNIGAGNVFDENLKSGQVVRIMTGAKVPDDVVKVIMLELTKKNDENHVRILKNPRAINVAEIGEEVSKNDLIVPKGKRINAGITSVLAAFGISEVQVFDQPKVAVVATGSELSENAEKNQGKIYNSNGPLLASLVKENHAILTGSYELTDDLDETRKLLSNLTAENDLVITTGGVSVGDFDFLAVIAKENEFLFNKLAMRPGSPTTGFVMNETPVIALSGNPSACFTGFWFFAEPMIQRFQNQKTQIRQTSGNLTNGYGKKNEFDRYLNGVLDENHQVTLSGNGNSSELASLYQSNCFYRIPHETAVPENGLVEVWTIPER